MLARICASLTIVVTVAACGTSPAPKVTPRATGQPSTATFVASSARSGPPPRATPTGAQTPLTTTTTAATAAPTFASGPVHIAGVSRLDGWSPDSLHLLADDDGTVLVVDPASGAFHRIDAVDAGWIDASTIAGLAYSSPGVGSLSLYGLDAVETMHIQGDFETAIFAPGTGRFAAVSSVPDIDATPPTYRVWDGLAMSEARPGEPLAWSADGSKLAILANTTPAKIGNDGTLSIVDVWGQTLLDVPGWIAGTHEPYVFSPDGAYLAACVQPSDDLHVVPDVHVVDSTTGAVSDSVGENGCFDYAVGWGPDSSLFVSEIGGSPVVWTPRGTSRLGTSFDWATPALNGNLAFWTDGRDDSTLKLRVGDATAVYALPGLRNVTWSPDGNTVAAISMDVEAGTGLTLIPVRRLGA